MHIILEGELITIDTKGGRVFRPGDRVEFPAGTRHKTRDKSDSGKMIIGVKKNYKIKKNNMAQLNPYVRFNDEKCREAMNFYKECLGGGELTFQTIGESPMAKEMPKEAQGRIMHASLKKGGVELFGSDMMRDKAVVGDNIVLSLNCDSEAEIKTIFSKLSAGGEIFMPLEKQFWGGLFGVITDKFGVEWMLNYQLEAEKYPKGHA